MGENAVIFQQYMKGIRMMKRGTKTLSEQKRSVLSELKQDPLWGLYAIAAVVLLVIIVVQNWRYMEQNVVVDVSGEMRYLKKVWETGNPFTPTYANSKELFFSRPWIIFVPLYAITRDLIIASKLTIIITTCLIAAAVVFLFKKLGWPAPQVMLGVLLFFGLISRHVDYALYMYFDPYSIFAIGSLLTYGCLADIHKTGRLTKGNAIIMSLTAIYFGMCGLRMFLYLYGPIIIVEVVTLIHQKLNRVSSSWFNVKVGCFLLCFFLVGLVIYKFILVPYMYRDDNLVLKTINLADLKDEFFNNLRYLLMAMGISFNGELVLSKEIIASFFMIGLLILMIYGVWLLRKEHAFLLQESKLLSYMLLSIIFLFFYSTITTQSLIHRHYFYIPPLIVILLISIYRYLLSRKDVKGLRYLFCLILCVGVCLISAVDYKSSEGVITPHMQLTEHLMEKGYDRVIGAFSTIGRVGFLSDDSIETITSTESDATKMWDWITDRTKYVNDDEPITLVLTRAENTNWSKDAKKTHLLSLAQEKSEAAGYFIYYYDHNHIGFDMLKFGVNARYNFLNFDYGEGASLDQGCVVLSTDSELSSPRCTLEPGVYDIVIRGKGLDSGSFTVLGDTEGAEQKKFELLDPSIADTEASFSIYVESEANDVSYRCSNRSEGDVWIYDITVDQRDKRPIWD